MSLGVPEAIGGGGGVLPPPDRFLRLDFDAVDRPVYLAAADPLLAGLLPLLRGWEVRIAAETALPEQGVALTSVLGLGETYALSSMYLDTPTQGLPAASAVCGIVADLAQRFFESRPDWLALHCGAFQSGGRLVLVTGGQRAGKSTLISRLSAEDDLTIVCDDVLPIDPCGRGHGLGAAPRLRLPLPGGASARFRDHVDACLRLRDDLYGYILPPTLAARGDAGPIAAVLVLDREEGAMARLCHVDPADAVSHLLQRNLAPYEDVAEVFDRVHRIASGATCLRLVYSDLEEAVALIRAALPPDGSWPAMTPGPALDALDEVGAGGPIEIPEGPLFRRNDVSVRRVPGSEALFLCVPETMDIVTLNATGRLIWDILEDPLDADEVADVLAEAFPDVDFAVIYEDVLCAIAHLHEARLVSPA
jgi:hypothetical protein